MMKGKRQLFFYCIILALVLVSNDISSQRESSDNYTDEILKKRYTYNDTLNLDFYSLKKGIDSLRPLLVIVHGGGFSGGKRDNLLEVKFAKEMAMKGYAVASISYRLTRKGKSFGCNCPAQEKIATFVSVSEDIGKALLYLTKSFNTLRFDPSKIILIGSSAGAEGVLNTVFMSNHYNFKHIEKVPVAGVISLAGAMIDKEYITEQNKIPVLFFHGVEDNLVPYGTAPHHYCSTDDPGYLILDGPDAIASKLKELGISFILAFDPLGNHDWAGLGYAQIPIIDMFIKKIIKEEVFIQSRIELSKTINE